MSLFKPSFSGGNRRAYSEEDKPQTRPELVRLILRDHFFSLIPANLILLVVFLPSLFWTFTGLFYIAQAMGTDGSLADFISLSRTWVVVMIPCLLITGPFLAGMSVMMRNLARDDRRFPKQYFVSGLKESWKSALVVSASGSLIPLLIWAAVAFYGPILAEGSQFAFIPFLLTIVLCAIWLMTLPTLYTMLGTYRQNLSHQIKNAFALTLSHLPLVTGVHLITLLPVLLGALAFVIGGTIFIAMLFILCIYYLFFGFAFAQLLYAFLANKLCEENLNSQIGADTHIGMR